VDLDGILWSNCLRLESEDSLFDVIDDHAFHEYFRMCAIDMKMISNSVKVLNRGETFVQAVLGDDTPDAQRRACLREPIPKP
jgi:hypothetical protein